jgi:predicted MFS family arabinose efflux permease
MHAGLTQTWFGLGAVALLLTIASWGGWPRERRRNPDQPSALARRRHPNLVALYLEYGLNAIGLVPHMIFLVDFVARGLGQGLGVGARYWVLFGLGALIGPLASGRLADGIGAAAAMRLAFALQAICVALLAVSTNQLSLTISSLIVGAMVPGIVSLALGRVHELLPDDIDGQRRVWGLCTTAFALGQAVAAYGFSYIFARTGGDYQLLYGIGAAALAAALFIDTLMVARSTRPRRAMSG